jgi:preprotein translocase subunit SecG
MEILETVISVVQIISIVIMVILILIQNGKSADLGASMGGGIGGGLVGPAGGATFLSRSTAIAATVFFSSTLLLVYLSNNHAHTPHKAGGQSVLAQVAAQKSLAASGAQENQPHASSLSKTMSLGTSASSSASSSAPLPLRIPGQ